MSIYFLESFAWASSDVSGNPWVERGYTVSESVSTNRINGREGSDFACLRMDVTIGNKTIVFPASRKAAMVIGFCYAITSSNSGVLLRIDFGSVGTTGARLDFTTSGINYTFGTSSFTHDIISNNGQSVFVELSIASSAMTLRVNNQVVRVHPGTGFTALAPSPASPLLSMFSPAQGGSGFLAISDVYLADDGIFRGDSYVKQLALTDNFINTGLKEGPNTIATGLKTFSNVDFISYDQSDELTLINLADLDGDVSFVKGVGIRMNTVKTNNDSVTAIPLIGVDNTAIELPGHAPGLNYAPKEYYTDNNPITSLPWTKDDINLLEVGVKRQ